jgi:cell division protein FtsQ
MRRLHWVAGVALLAVGLSGWLWGDEALSRLEWFEVKRVEVAGNRYLAPHDVLRAASIHRGQSVWDDAESWEDALRAHPGIEDARVTRRLPGTLRVRIREKSPIAYVQARSLMPATAAGEIFPIDPARAPLDLPIVRGPWPDTLAAGPTRRLLAEVGRLGELDPGLLADVSEIRTAANDPAVLILSHRLGEITLPGGASPDRLAELRAVLQDLDRRGALAPEGTGPASVDVRFEAQIVVRFQSSV